MPLVLDPIQSGYNLSKINDNFQRIEATWDEKLDRVNSGSFYNQMDQALDMNSNEIINAVTGDSDGSLVTKGYVDQQDELRVLRAGDSMSGQLNTIDPVDLGNATNKRYVDGLIASIDGVDGIVPLVSPRQQGDGVTTVFPTIVTSQHPTQSYSVNLDGVTQRPQTDYTADTNGNVVFAEAPEVGVDIDITVYEPVNLQEAADFSQVTATGSTTPRTLADRFADTVNVLDFGAVGDGVNDDRAAIQAAVDYALPLGKNILFPTPTVHYAIKSTHPTQTDYGIVVPTIAQGLPASSMIGGGKETHIKLETPSSIVAMLFYEGASYGRRMENLYWNADYKATNVWLAFEAYHPYMHVEDCSFYRATAECVYLATFMTNFTRVTSAWGTEGFHMTGSGVSRLVTSLSMSSCYAVNCSDYGFWFDELTYCSFDACGCDGSGVAYYIDIARGVSMTGCGTESSTKMLEVRACQGMTVNGFMALNVGDSGTPVDNLIQIETGESFTISGVYITESSGQYDKKLELLTGSFQSACVVVLDSSISPTQARWVSNISFDKPIKFVVYDTTNRNRTYTITNYEHLLEVMEKEFTEKTILHNITFQLPDGDFYTNTTTLLPDCAGSGSVTFQGGVSTRWIVRTAETLQMARYKGEVTFKDLDFQFDGTNAVGLGLYDCDNVVFENVNVVGGNPDDKRINLSASKIFLSGSQVDVNWTLVGRWDITTPLSSNSPTTGVWPTGVKVYDQFPSASRIGWARTSTGTWVEF